MMVKQIGESHEGDVLIRFAVSAAASTPVRRSSQSQPMLEISNQ
jgi:hypothetical protein